MWGWVVGGSDAGGVQTRQVQRSRASERASEAGQTKGGEERSPKGRIPSSPEAGGRAGSSDGEVTPERCPEIISPSPEKGEVVWISSSRERSGVVCE